MLENSIATNLTLPYRGGTDRCPEKVLARAIVRRVGELARLALEGKPNAVQGNRRNDSMNLVGIGRVITKS